MRELPRIKNELGINVELASPGDFIPLPAEWEGRAISVAREGLLSFAHFDPYSQALSKLERGHVHDLEDVEAMLRLGLVDPSRLRELFAEIEPELYRFPGRPEVPARSSCQAVRLVVMIRDLGSEPDTDTSQLGCFAVEVDDATRVVRELDLDVMTAGVCLPCLTFVAFPLDSGDERGRGAKRGSWRRTCGRRASSWHCAGARERQARRGCRRERGDRGRARSRVAVARRRGSGVAACGAARGGHSSSELRRDIEVIT